MTLTADDVHVIEFRNAPIGRRGYAREQVDEFMERIARTLDGQDDLTPAEVHHVVFAKPIIGRRGYDEREVDEFLDRAEEELAHLSGLGVRGVPCAREHDQAGVARYAEPDHTTSPSSSLP